MGEMDDCKDPTNDEKILISDDALSNNLFMFKSFVRG